MFSADAYNNGSRIHSVSLTVQDILRWLVIAAMVAGAVFKLLAGSL
jgi:hypothetical protein